MTPLLLTIAQIMLLASGGFVVYTYVGYPLLIGAAGQLLRRQPRPLHRHPPKVSVVMAIHNGAAYLPDKLQSLRQQDYPAEQVEIVAISDGSDDGTDALLAAQDVVFEALPERSGKPTALNAGVALASGEIVVFTDVRQRLSSNAISELVDTLADPKVGAASGELMLDGGDGSDGRDVGLYWRYEKWIRRMESLVHSTAGVTGALYAINRADYQPLPADTLLDDFDVPAAILRSRKRVVLVPGARAFDRAEADAGRESVRKIRTLTGNFQSFARHRWLFNPLRNPIFVQFLSHKVFRLLVPYALLLFLLACIILPAWWATALAMLQVVFYALGWLGASMPELRLRSRLLSFIHTFIQLNGAAVVAAWRFFLGRYQVTWEKTT